MTAHAIVRPLPPAVITPTGFAAGAAAALASNEPKQVAVANGGAASIKLDLGAAVTFDTLFIGFTTDAGAGSFSCTCGNATGAETALGVTNVLPTKLIGARRHFLLRLGAPVTARYVIMSNANLAAGYQIGKFAVGLAFSPTYGPEFDHGAGIEDTAIVTNRKDGGLGMDPGVTVGTWNWQLGDLTDDERDTLYGILRYLGLSKPAIVIEGLGLATTLHESVHWCTFTRIEKYERYDAGLTRWAFTIRDWE